MEQKQFNIENHTPEEALELLSQYAMSVKIDGTLQAARSHIAGLNAAYSTLMLVLESKQRTTPKTKTMNTFNILDGDTIVTSAPDFCAACSACIALPQGPTYVIHDTVNNLAWNGPRPTNPPS